MRNTRRGEKGKPCVLFLANQSAILISLCCRSLQIDDFALTVRYRSFSVLTDQNYFCSCAVYETNNSNTCRDPSPEKTAFPPALAELSKTTIKEKLA